MERKQILTNDNIKTDIKNIIKRPAQLSRAEYWKSRKGLLVFDILLILGMLAFQAHYKFVLLIGLIFITAYLIVDYFSNKNRMKKVSIDDYEIKKEAVSYIKEESYRTDHKIHISPTVRKIHTAHVYIMHFENGKTWNMPKSNYKWSGECPMSDIMIYQTTHRGDLFWTVIEKATDKIVMAYPAEYFEYKD